MKQPKIIDTDCIELEPDVWVTIKLIRFGDGVEEPRFFLYGFPEIDCGEFGAQSLEELIKRYDDLM
jgi:hypothetical protein